MTPEHVEQDVEHVAHHPFQIVRALHRAIDPVETFEETQVGLAFLFEPGQLGDVGPHTRRSLSHVDQLNRISPRSTAFATASVRLVAPSFSNR